jgi:hypothetical protein
MRDKRVGVGVVPHQSLVAVALMRSAISPRSKQSPASWTVGPVARTWGPADALLLDA